MKHQQESLLLRPIIEGDSFFGCEERCGKLTSNAPTALPLSLLPLKEVYRYVYSEHNMIHDTHINFVKAGQEDHRSPR